MLYMDHSLLSILHLDLSCEDPVQNTSNDTILFLDVLCQSDSLNDMENVLKIANRLSNHTRDLLKLSLQQAIILVVQQALTHTVNLTTFVYIGGRGECYNGFNAKQDLKSRFNRTRIQIFVYTRSCTVDSNGSSQTRLCVEIKNSQR